MSLDYNLTKIRAYKETCYRGEGDDHEMSGVTNTLIWMTLRVGIGQITQANWRDFFKRLRLIELVHGPTLQKRATIQDEELMGARYITAKDVYDHVGLYTNAHFKKTSSAAFLKSLLIGLEVNVDEEMEEAEVARHAMFAMRASIQLEELIEDEDEQFNKAYILVQRKLDAKWTIGRAYNTTQKEGPA